MLYLNFLLSFALLNLDYYCHSNDDTLVNTAKLCNNLSNPFGSYHRYYSRCRGTRSHLLWKYLWCLDPQVVCWFVTSTLQSLLEWRWSILLFSLLLAIQEQQLHKLTVSSPLIASKKKSQTWKLKNPNCQHLTTYYFRDTNDSFRTNHNLLPPSKKCWKRLKRTVSLM